MLDFSARGLLFQKMTPSRKATAPPLREGLCCEARLRAEQQKGWAGQAFLLLLLWEFPGQNRRKRNKPLQSDNFSSLRLSVREKFLEWYQTYLEVDFWTLRREVGLL